MGTMKQAYLSAGLARYYFDEAVPCDLWRGQKKSAQKSGEFILQPVTVEIELITTSGRRVRAPDVEVFTRNGMEWIKGCRTIRHGGAHWGISCWSEPPKFALVGGWANFKIPKGAPVPSALAVTQDDDNQFKPNHYSIAPKDDMPLALFIQHLKELAKHIVIWEKNV